ncbi:MAG: S1 RNA-binding domain-containing protein [Bacilli bacterium]|nr:S1 RNA-binding domain-containing protein [Bacilli bacterium]
MKKYEVGKIVKCLVTGIENYGIFVKVDDEYSGLIHISEITVHFVRSVNDYVTIGEEIYCKVIEQDENNKQLKLSIKNINYKSNGEEINSLESKNGFKPLKENLIIWTKEKLTEYKDIEK